MTLIIRDLILAFMWGMEKPVGTMELLAARGVKDGPTISEKTATRHLMHRFVEKGLVRNVQERPRGLLKFVLTEKGKVIAKLAYARFSRDALWWSYVLSVIQGRDGEISDGHPPQILTTCNNGKTHVDCDICGKRTLYSELRPTLEREGSFTCECGNNLTAEAFQAISRVIVRTRGEVLAQRSEHCQPEKLPEKDEITISLKDYTILRKAYKRLRHYVGNGASDPDNTP